MHNSKLLQIIGTLTDKELKDLEKFLLLQVPNTSKVFSLFEIIKKAYPNVSNSNLSKAEVYKVLFNDKTYKDVKVRELMSALRRVVDQFLIYLEHNKTDFYNQLSLLKQYRKRKLSVLFEQQTKVLEQTIQKDEFLNTENHKRNYLLSDEKNNFFEQQQIRIHDESIILKNESFDKYYFSSKLRILCELINRDNILSANYQINLAEEIIPIIEKHKDLLLATPPILCFLEIYYLLQTQDNEEQFTKAFNTINQYQKSFKDRELKTLYNYLLNYCIRHVNMGVQKFTPKLFELQKLLLQNRIFLENDVLSHISFRNIVSIAIKLKEYSWVEKFIEEYKIFVSEQYQENAYNLSKSNLFYAQKDYHETISLLNQVEFTDVYYACFAKVTLLKAYYALREIETLDYFVSSFQLYLKRNKEISSGFKKSSENFLKHFKKLLLIIKQLEYKENKKLEKKIKDLTENISAEKAVANKVWLLEEIDKVKL